MIFFDLIVNSSPGAELKKRKLDVCKFLEKMIKQNEGVPIDSIFKNHEYRYIQVKAQIMNDGQEIMAIITDMTKMKRLAEAKK